MGAGRTPEPRAPFCLCPDCGDKMTSSSSCQRAGVRGVGGEGSGVDQSWPSSIPSAKENFSCIPRFPVFII